ncbi:CWF19-like protein 2 [Centruroides sculpturatus]|uniref:CWF19-like protein 2 n=1 Tax=Centruroides sculpturatus TaxID=218467 RepID=UPI000C6D536F|nr:CWF19-like protein 2 [Centruroides sculpturatus]
MFEKERKTTIDDQNSEFARLFAKQSKNDDDESFLVEAAKIKPQIKQEYRNRSQAIHEHMRRSSALKKCQFCLDSSHMKKHLIVSLGKTVYLSLPSCQSLVDYHCYIVPMDHVTSGTLLDKDVWSEIQTFKKRLTKMFDEMDKTVIFMETSIHHRWHPHCFIECIPVSKEDGDVAPMYFKKAIMESETEWSLNKKLIDLYKKDLLHSVPKGLPYFHVEFGTSGGFAHIVEEEKLFPLYFGKEVIGGIKGIAPIRWRKPPKEEFKKHWKKVLQFEKQWERACYDQFC